MKRIFLIAALGCITMAVFAQEDGIRRRTVRSDTSSASLLPTDLVSVVTEVDRAQKIIVLSGGGFEIDASQARITIDFTDRLGIEAVQEGQTVLVQIEPQPPRSPLRASLIQIRHRASGEVSGRIERVDPVRGEIEIMGSTIKVIENDPFFSTIFVRQSAIEDLDSIVDLAEGDRVIVDFARIGDDLSAIRIERINPPSAELTFQARIIGIDGFVYHTDHPSIPVVHTTNHSRTPFVALGNQAIISARIDQDVVTAYSIHPVCGYTLPDTGGAVEGASWD